MLTMFDDSELNNYKAKYGKSIPYFTLDENPIIPGEKMLMQGLILYLK